jgi:hypothetical protein
LKTLGAALLAIAFFLPLSRCEEISLTPSAEDEVVQETPETEKVYDYYYAYENIGFEDQGSLLIPAVFFWPLAFLAYAKRGRRARVKTVLNFLEPLLAAGTGYMIVLMTMFNEFYIGAYVAFAGAGGYFIGSGIEVAWKIKTTMDNRRQK